MFNEVKAVKSINIPRSKPPESTRRMAGQLEFERVDEHLWWQQLDGPQNRPRVYSCSDFTPRKLVCTLCMFFHHEDPPKSVEKHDVLAGDEKA